MTSLIMFSAAEINPNLAIETPKKIQSTHGLLHSHIHTPKTTTEKLKEAGEHIQEDAEVLAEIPELVANISKLLDDNNILLVVGNEVYSVFAISTLESIITLCELLYKSKEKFDLVSYQQKLIEYIARFSFISTFMIGMYAWSQGLVGANSEEETNDITPLIVILSIATTVSLLTEKKLWAKIHHENSLLHRFASILGKGLLEAGKMRALLYGLSELTALGMNNEALVLDESVVLFRYLISLATGVYYGGKEITKIYKQHHDSLAEEHEHKDTFDYAKDSALALTLMINMLISIGEASEIVDARIIMGTCISLLTLFLLKAVAIGKEVNYSNTSTISIEEITDEEAALLNLSENHSSKVEEPKNEAHNNNDYDSDNEETYKNTNQHCNLFQLIQRALPCNNNENTHERTNGEQILCLKK